MTRAEQARRGRWRLKVLLHVRDEIENEYRTCWHSCISGPTFYKWSARSGDLGEVRRWAMGGGR